MIRRSLENFLSWAVVIVALLLIFVWFPQQTTRISGLQLGLTCAAVVLSAVPLVRLAKSQVPGRHSWIAVHSGVVALGVMSPPLLPQWCGYITASVFLLFAFTPRVLSDLASRRLQTGHLRAAASYAR